MNRNIQKTMIFFASLCMINFAIAMDPSQADSQEEILSILQKHGKDAAIEFLESMGNKSENKARYLKALKDTKKEEFIKTICNDYWRRYLKESTDSLVKTIFIERIISLLIDSYKPLSHAFASESSNNLVEIIQELQNLNEAYGRRRPFSEIERDISATSYSSFLRPHRNLTKTRNDNSDLLEDNDNKLSTIIIEILIGIENDLVAYCNRHFFHICVKYYDEKGEICDNGPKLNSLVGALIKDLPTLKDIIAARTEINLKIMEIQALEELNLKDFNQIGDIIELTVHFVRKFTEQTAESNFATIAYINKAIIKAAYTYIETLNSSLEKLDTLSSSLEQLDALSSYSLVTKNPILSCSDREISLTDKLNDPINPFAVYDSWSSAFAEQKLLKKEMESTVFSEIESMDFSIMESTVVSQKRKCSRPFFQKWNPMSFHKSGQ